MHKVTGRQLWNSLKEDPLNLKGLRNKGNMSRHAYNCGGFALSVYDWVCPYIQTDDDDANDCHEGEYTDAEREMLMQIMLANGWSREEIEEEILQKDVNFLLNQYPFLTPVNLSDCALDDTVVAYRIFIEPDTDSYFIDDTDFHFKVRINGFWFEKLGSDVIHLCQLDDDKPWIMSRSGTQYTSKIVYFIVDKNFLKNKS